MIFPRKYFVVTTWLPCAVLASEVATESKNVDEHSQLLFDPSETGSEAHAYSNLAPGFLHGFGEHVDDLSVANQFSAKDYVRFQLSKFYVAHFSIFPFCLPFFTSRDFIPHLAIFQHRIVFQNMSTG